MFNLFQKVDNDLYEDLSKKNELEMFDFLSNKDESFLKQKNKTIHKVLKEKKWTVNYLMDCAANRELLKMAKETNAEIIFV